MIKSIKLFLFLFVLIFNSNANAKPVPPGAGDNVDEDGGHAIDTCGDDNQYNKTMTSFFQGQGP